VKKAVAACPTVRAGVVLTGARDARVQEVRPPRPQEGRAEALLTPRVQKVHAP